jgi:uroporphyrinogen-III synthase
MTKERKKKRLAAVGLIVVAVTVFAVRHVFERRAQAKRDASYQQALHSYSAALRPGLSRDAVENYLREKNVKFRQMCCANHKSPSYEVYDDLVRVGQEDAPWFCSESNVYVAFQFAGQRANSGWSAEPDDRLTSLFIYGWLEDCM